MNAIAKQEQAALTLPERASVALGSPAHEVKLRELVLSSAAILTVTNKAGREECHTAYMTLKNTRVSITHTVEDVTEDAKLFVKAVNTEATRLIEITQAEEKRLQALRDAWDEAEQARKDALIAAERARMDKIRAEIDFIKSVPLKHVGSTSADLAVTLELHLRLPITEAEFQEFTEEAKQANGATLEKLREMGITAAGAEQVAAEAETARLAEVARIAAEREELALLRAAAAETARLQKIETDRIAAEQAVEAKRLADLAAQTEANMRAERAALDEQMRIEHERVAAESKRQLEAQQAAIAAERARANEELAAKQAELNAAVAAHDAKLALELEAANAEATRVAAEADNEAERQRLQDCATQHLGDNSEAFAAFLDSPLDESLSDDEIIELVAATFSLSALEAIDRLAVIDFAAARNYLMVAA